MMKTMKKENNNITSNETVIDDNTSIDTGKSNFEIVKVKEDDFKNYYEIEEQYEIINKQYFNIDKRKYKCSYNFN